MNETNNKNIKKIILGVIIICVIMGLAACFVIAYNNTKKLNNQTNTITMNSSNTSSKTTNSTNTSSDTTSSISKTATNNSKNMNLTSGGNYDLSGEYESITVNTSEEVTLNLNNVTIVNSSGPAINIEKAKNVTIVLSGTNKITSTTTEDLNGAIYSKSDLVFAGTGSIEVKSNSDSAKGLKAEKNITIEGGNYNINSTDDGIHTNGNITINNGKFAINSDDDGIHADGMIEINNGTFDITAHEGIEATYVKINDGTINISASDDGINAGQKSNIGTPTIEINGGNITIKMGQGDTDGVDSNGDIVINGGTISVTGQSTFDYDGTGIINGGTVICNGQQVTTLPNQFMGGGMKGGMPGQMNQNGEMPNGGRQGR